MSQLTRHFDGRYLALVERDGWEYVTRTTAYAVAVLVPVTRQRELVLVEQYRVPVGRNVIELPAGLVGDGDDPEESMELGARRELEEETGYRAGKLTPILDTATVAGLSDELITVYLAEDLERVGAGGGDDSEDIRVHHVSLDSVDAWLAGQQARGRQLDPKIFAALYWLRYPQARVALASSMDSNQ